MEHSTFFMPPKSLIGKGAIKSIGEEIKSREFKKALIVTDKNLIEVGLLKNLTDILKREEIDYAIYDGVKENPTIKNIEDAEKVFKENNCDFLISFGGGSSHDTTKGTALVLANGGHIRDYAGLNLSKKPQMPMIAVNTTAGTASEMTIFAIITDEEAKIKLAVVDEHFLPILAINDSELMTKMPKGLTAATGMDALTHAVEAYVSTAASPITDASAQKAIELISKSLIKAVENGDDQEAREDMAYAEYLAGMAFSNASLGYVHALAHQLGGVYNLAHGVLNSILLPNVQEFNIKNASKRLADIAIFMGLDVEGLSKKEAATKAVLEMRNMGKQVGLPQGLEELGVKEEDFDFLATNAMADPCSLTNPVEASKEEVIEMLKKSM